MKKITLDNIDSFEFINSKDKTILISLINDLTELNSYIGCNFCIYIEDKHTEWSPERCDPCPDYYGYYIIGFDPNNNEYIGDYMDLNELDNTLYILHGLYYNKLLKHNVCVKHTKKLDFYVIPDGNGNFNMNISSLSLAQKNIILSLLYSWEDNENNLE